MEDHGAADEVVQYLVFRGDLRLAKGKAAAQAGHAVQLVIRAIERSGEERAKRWLADWEAGSYTKIAVRVADLVQLRDLATRLDSARIIHVEVVDEGRTAIQPGTATVLGLQPVPKSLVASIVGALPLY
ncbi:MAG: aminoacyl-tRNA hydrolase [Polyangiaceae bacterium]